MNKINIIKMLLILLIVSINNGFSQDEIPSKLQIRDTAISHFQSGKFSKAHVLFEDFLEENPFDYEVQYFLGQTAYHLEKWDEAINLFKNSISNGYKIAKAQYNIARCYSIKKDKVQAHYWLKMAINNLPSFYYQWMKDKEFEILAKDENYFNDLYNYDRNAKDRDSQWKADIDFFNERMKQFHYSLYRNISEDSWNEKINRLKTEVQNLNDTRIIVRLMELTATIGDGHTVMVPPVSGKYQFGMSPFLFYTFDDGVYIIEAHKEYTQLLGAKIISINNIPIAEVLERVRAVIPSDNEYGSKWFEQLALSIPEILYGLDIIDSREGFTLQFIKNEEKNSVQVNVSEKLNADFLRTWMYGFHELKDGMKVSSTEIPSARNKLHEPYWFEYLPESELVVFHYNQVQTDVSESEQQFSDRLNLFIKENDVKALVIDLRYNEGGDNTTYGPILNGIIANENINNSGNLFVLIGRRTFSAGMCFAVELERSTNAIFVGEPTGSSPNFVGEVGGVFQLPYSGIYFNASNLYWQNSYAFDNRKYISPEIYIPEEVNDYKNGVDRAMEAIIQLKEKD